MQVKPLTPRQPLNDNEKAAFDMRVEEQIKRVKKMLEKKYTDGCVKAPKLTITQGKRYAKVWRTDIHEYDGKVTEGQKSIYWFIDTRNGDVLRPASYNAPAKHPRGNIFNDDYGVDCIGPYGVAYLK